jgi:hypothetical protein
MGNGSGVSPGDRNRNARLDRLRVLVPVENAMGRHPLTVDDRPTTNHRPPGKRRTAA